jgi:hypothetical protein
MQTIIDVLMILTMLAFIVHVLVELVQSQKGSEKYTEMPTLLRIGVDLKNMEGPGWTRYNHHADNLQELQEYVNEFPMFRIQRAAVWTGTTMTHVMTPLGVLEPV